MFREPFEGIGTGHRFSYETISQFENQQAEEKVGLLYLVSRRRVKVLGPHKRGYSQPIVGRDSRKTCSIFRIFNGNEPDIVKPTKLLAS